MSNYLIRTIEENEHDDYGTFASHVIMDGLNEIVIELHPVGIIRIDAILCTDRTGLFRVLDDLCDFCQKKSYNRILFADELNGTMKAWLLDYGFVEEITPDHINTYLSLVVPQEVCHENT